MIAAFVVLFSFVYCYFIESSWQNECQPERFHSRTAHTFIKIIYLKLNATKHSWNYYNRSWHSAHTCSRIRKSTSANDKRADYEQFFFHFIWKCVICATNKIRINHIKILWPSARRTAIRSRTSSFSVVRTLSLRPHSWKIRIKFWTRINRRSRQASNTSCV